MFTADWHIKTTAKDVPSDWVHFKFRELFKEIYKVEPLVDIHIIGGDIFDKLPNMEELQLYFEFISNVKVPTLIFPGNHEAIKKTTTFLSYLKIVTSKINPLVTIHDKSEKSMYNGTFDIIPYTELKTFNPTEFISPILFTHVRGDIPPHVKAEIPLEKLEHWDLVLAGDLHSYENCQRNILYPGSPTTISFHRVRTDTGAIIIDTDTLKHTFVRFKVPQLLKKTVSVGEETPVTEYDYTVYEIEGSLDTLAQINTCANTVKKPTARSADARLILDPKFTLVQELKEYLEYIANITDIDAVLDEFHKVQL